MCKKSFVLVRECRGTCDNFSGGEWIAAATMVIPGEKTFKCLFLSQEKILHNLN